MFALLLVVAWGITSLSAEADKNISRRVRVRDAAINVNSESGSGRSGTNKFSVSPLFFTDHSKRAKEQESHHFWQRFLEEESSLPKQPSSDTASGTSILEILSRELDLSFFYSLFMNTFGDEFLGQLTTTYTVFAPTNDAFDSFDEDELSRLLQPEMILHLHFLVGGHVVRGAIYESNLTESVFIDSLVEPNNITAATTMGGEIVLNGELFSSVPVLQTDMVGSDGIVHKVGGILLYEFFYLNIIDELSMYKYDSMMAMFDLIVRAELDEFVRDSVLTIIWPLDSAFEQDLPDEVSGALSDLNDTEALRRILLSHMIPGFYPSDVLIHGLELVTVRGSRIVYSEVILEDGSTQHYFNDIIVEEFDFASRNAIAHYINSVMLVPPPETTRL